MIIIDEKNVFNQARELIDNYDLSGLRSNENVAINISKNEIVNTLDPDEDISNIGSFIIRNVNFNDQDRVDYLISEINELEYDYTYNLLNDKNIDYFLYPLIEMEELSIVLINKIIDYELDDDFDQISLLSDSMSTSLYKYNLMKTKFELISPLSIQSLTELIIEFNILDKYKYSRAIMIIISSEFYNHPTQEFYDQIKEYSDKDKSLLILNKMNAVMENKIKSKRIDILISNISVDDYKASIHYEFDYNSLKRFHFTDHLDLNSNLENYNINILNDQGEDISSLFIHRLGTDISKFDMSFCSNKMLQADLILESNLDIKIKEKILKHQLFMHIMDIETEVKLEEYINYKFKELISEHSMFSKIKYIFNKERFVFNHFA